MKLEVKNLTKTFSDTEVLHGISFSVENGKALGLLGRNGAGKTTTIRILMDVFKCNSGEILLDGKAFIPSEYQIGYLPEERGLYPKKNISEQIVYLAMLRGLSKKEAKINTEKWLKKLGVLEYANKPLDNLSKGNQQKVQLAQTLVCDPEIVILDEPFSGLDPVNSQILKDVVRELIDAKKLVIFSSHQMNYVEEFCEDIVIINKGNVVLNGNLKDIKRAYGMNRLLLSSNNYTPSNLASIISSNFSDKVILTDTKKDFIVIELINNTTKNSFINEITKTDIDIERFAIYEPTLNDIFVMKVGEQ